MLGYRVPAPDEAMLISRGKAGRDGTPFRVVTGPGAFVMPFFRQVRSLTLSMGESEMASSVSPGRASRSRYGAPGAAANDSANVATPAAAEDSTASA